MQIQTKEVREGLHTGKTVWICHYNRPDMHKKALRNVPPTKCLIKSTDELPNNKTIYYSQAYFTPYNKTGKLSTKIISPVDNTGFRTRCGNELYVFDNEEDCNAEWNTQVNNHAKRIDKIILTIEQQWKNEKELLINKLL